MSVQRTLTEEEVERSIRFADGALAATNYSDAPREL
jgi:hypothetical protein